MPHVSSALTKLTALDGGEWSASAQPIYYGEGTPPNPRIDLQRLRRLQRWSEGSDREKNLCAREELNPDCLVV